MSDHFDGQRFFNPGGRGPRSLGSVLRWKLEGGRESWPDIVPSPFPFDEPPARPDPHELRVAFVGHATFLIQTGGLNMLTDPIWSRRASPVSFVGPKRHNPPGIRFEALPPIDVVLLSHNHYDHLDLATLDRLWARDRPRIVAPLGNDTIIRQHDVRMQVDALDWGESLALRPGVQVWLEAAHHWSARGTSDRNRALWGSFVLASPPGKVFFAGDTGFNKGKPFRAVSSRHPRIDLALLPIGAYEPRWFMAPQHMNPDDAVKAMDLLGARQALGYHWGTFQLTNEGAQRPAEDLAAALRRHGVAAERFFSLRPGQVWKPEP